jgi:hypothetical protein
VPHSGAPPAATTDTAAAANPTPPGTRRSAVLVAAAGSSVAAAAAGAAAAGANSRLRVRHAAARCGQCERARPRPALPAQPHALPCAAVASRVHAQHAVRRGAGCCSCGWRSRPIAPRVYVCACVGRAEAAAAAAAAAAWRLEQPVACTDGVVCMMGLLVLP